MASVVRSTFIVYFFTKKKLKAVVESRYMDHAVGMKRQGTVAPTDRETDTKMNNSKTESQYTSQKVRYHCYRLGERNRYNNDDRRTVVRSNNDSLILSCVRDLTHFKHCPVTTAIL